jgi:hypothetical protein
MSKTSLKASHKRKSLPVRKGAKTADNSKTYGSAR